MGKVKVLYDMSKAEVVAMNIKKTQCLYLEKFEYFYPHRYFCRLKGLWVTLSQCDKCNVGILKSGDGKIIIGQKRLTEYMKIKSNKDMSKRPLSEKGLTKHN